MRQDETKWSVLTKNPTKMEKLSQINTRTLRIVHVNRASVTFYCEATGERYLATTKLANQILSGLHPDIYLMPREYQGEVTTWLATLSIFV